ncbi:hypothetical protein [Bauldia sp.]|uniref:hypothetical protein n=1 Tax=Bauldia sp. TaxID=2575872 RepID=UPI0025C378DD|nr:hypothetical protein [Bauldia sp.]
MKTVILSAIGLLALAGSAHAGIPFVNATCPGNIEVHADEGGPIYVNGKEAKITVSKASYYEAKHGHVTISLSVNPDGSPSVSYTGKGGANGICQLTDGRSAGNGGNGKGNGGCPVDVSEADRYKYPACN